RCSHRNVAGYPGGDSAETITNTAIHEIDITRWLFGSEIVEVSWHAGKSTRADPHRQDPQLLLMRNENGTLTVLDVFVNARCSYRHGSTAWPPTSRLRWPPLRMALPPPRWPPPSSNR